MRAPVAVLNESFLSDAFAGREGQTPPFKGRAHAAPALCKTTLLSSSKLVPSWASRASLANEGFFGGRPRRPLKFTDLPPTVRPVAAESPAVEESIEEGGEEGREHAPEINNRVNVLMECGERERECGVERERVSFSCIV